MSRPPGPCCLRAQTFSDSLDNATNNRTGINLIVPEQDVVIVLPRRTRAKSIDCARPDELTMLPAEQARMPTKSTDSTPPGLLCLCETGAVTVAQTVSSRGSCNHGVHDMVVYVILKQLIKETFSLGQRTTAIVLVGR